MTDGGWKRWVRGGLALLLFGGAVVALVWLVPPLLYRVVPAGVAPDAQLTAIAQTRTALVAGLAGLAAVGSLWVNARNIQIGREALDASLQAQADAREAQRETLRLSREGHITDRLSKAVEQLGHEATATRIGGIYALERIMRDSDSDHAPVVEILTAFVREHAKHRGSPSATNDTADFMPGPPVPGLAPLAADVQAAVTVLSRRPDRRENGPLDLRGVDLRGVRAHAAKLDEAVLTGALLDHADFGQASLKKARLRACSLKGAWLRAADFREASLKGADLTGSYLVDVQTQGADLSGVLLESATQGST